MLASTVVPHLAQLVPVVREEQSGVVMLLHRDDGDAGPVVLLRLYAGMTDGRQLELQYSIELFFRDSISKTVSNRIFTIEDVTETFIKCEEHFDELENQTTKGTGKGKGKPKERQIIWTLKIIHTTRA